MPPTFPGPNPAGLQTPQQLLATGGSASLDLAAIQGDAVIGLQKKWERFVFFTISAEVGKFKSLLGGTIAVRLTSAERVHEREGLLSARKLRSSPTEDGPSEPPLLRLIGVNVAFSFAGLTKLLPQAQLQDPNILQLARSPAQIAAACGDAMNGANPASWEATFLAAQIDGVFLVTGGTREEVDAERAVLLAKLGTTATEVWVDGAIGNVRPGVAAQHEHFGWRDGLSQPAIRGVAEPFPGQDTIPAGQFIFGTEGAPPAPPWMANGSLMVFRKLEQDVTGFNTFVEQDAARLDMDADLLGARMVGRWKSGAPVVKAPLEDVEALAADPRLNNDFDFADDVHQRRCPYGAHIRKTNPRADFPGGVSSHRIMRAGIPYGTEAALDPATPRGLHFVCYQTSLQQQFELIQGSWANNPMFIFGKSRAAAAPAHTSVAPAPAFEQIEPGHDPIIGQASGGRFMEEPFPNHPTGSERSRLEAMPTFVTPRACAYFFLPSIPAITDVLAI